MSLEIITSIAEMERVADQLRSTGKRIGVVPTMGYLHEGHLSLVRIAKKNADVVITTIFVNPIQFSPHEDFSSYPRDLQRDVKLVEGAGSDVVFAPDTQAMYPENYMTYVEVEKITDVLEGKFRPTHFRGVTSVVAKLFNIAKPHVAVFGQKDAQQAVVVKQMVHDLNFGIDIIVGPIVREPDGLAMSSRNVYLSPPERSEATVLVQSLRLAEELIRSGEKQCTGIIQQMHKLISSKSTTQIDYISVADSSTLQEYSQLHTGLQALISIAVRIGRTRLIDNTLVTVP